MTTSPVTLAEVRAAADRLAPVLRPTPATFSHSLSERVGRPVWIKPEHRQRTGSFKIRGAYNLQSQLGAGASVVAASAGNHAQGVALAARLLDQHATIVMPRAASLPKVQATRAYGAEVVLAGDTTDEAIGEAQRLAADTAATLVPPFDHRHIIAGQGTIGLELQAEVPELASVVVAVGGGGLAAGIGVGLEDTSVRLIGVAASGAAGIAQSFETGVATPQVPRTIADGIALAAPSELTLAHLRSGLDELVTVTDEQISRALLLMLERAKAAVEPAGATPLAPLVDRQLELPEGPVAVVVGGGNVDPLLLSKLIEYALGVAGRYLALRVVVEDRPGALAAVTDAVADLGLNVLDVEHHRSGLQLPLGQVEVHLTTETSDHDHRLEVVAALGDRGFDVQMVE